MKEKMKENIKNYFRSYKEFSFWRILAYFIIYSVIGFILETLFGLATTGVIESRKSFLYGPFCGVYGLGAVVMIITLSHFKKSNARLFLGGLIVGSIVEYAVSFFGELLFSVKWWDYSSEPLNINGRICVYYSVIWGVLAIFLISIVNPRIDKFIDFIKKKIPGKYLKTVEMTILSLIVIDFIISVYAMVAFYARTVVERDIDVDNKGIINVVYEVIYSNEEISKLTKKLFSDEKMMRTFPNLKMRDRNGEMIYFDSLFPDAKTYYFKLELKKPQSE
jgi:uncharacterized membrane protein